MSLGMRQHLAAIFWIVGTTAVVAGAQVVTTRAAAERRVVTRLNIALVENKVRIRELEAELRTRAGLPELQRWNDAVFQLSAPQTVQILNSPVQLVAYAARPEAKAPALRYALARDGGDAAPETPPQALAVPSGPRLVAASYVAQPAAGAPTPLLPEPATDTPEDSAGEPQDREG